MTDRLDPNKLFVVSTVSRIDIAQELNDVIESQTFPTAKVPLFDADDPRLTDEVCQAIANALYDASCDLDEVVEQDFNVYASALDQFE